MKPLTFINTRAEHQLASLSETIEAHGGISLEVPLIQIKAVKPAEVPEVTGEDWLVFTSVNSVRFWTELTPSQPMGKAACVGEKTKRYAAAAGYDVALVPDTYDAETLAEVLLQHTEKGARMIYPRSAKSRSVLKSKLEAAERIVLDPVIYDTVPNHRSREALNQALESADGVLLLSPSAVHAFFQFAAPEKLSGVFFGCIGSVTQKACRSYTQNEIIVPETFTIETLMKTIMKEKVKS